MTIFDSNQDRRQYPRVNAPVYCRPARFTSSRKPLFDIGLGGIRVYSDEIHKVGERLEIDLFLPDEASITCKVKVVWLNPLPEESIAKYEVGLQFLEVPSNILQRLAGILEKETE